MSTDTASVTDNRSVQLSRTDTRNDLGELAAVVHATTSTSSSESSSEFDTSKVHPAERTGDTCGNCGSPIDHDQRAYRCAYRRRWGSLFGTGSFVFAYATTCGNCYSSTPFLHLAGGEHEIPTECYSCHRRLVVGGYRANQRWVACSTRCLAALRREDRRDKRSTTTCSTCGETFTPARADARYCSSACRQRAYRQRHTSTTANGVTP